MSARFPICTDYSRCPQAIAAIERFQDLVTEQINTSGDTIEDWGDLVPDEVAKIKEQTAALEAHTSNQ
jgi:hypothetical protein